MTSANAEQLIGLGLANYTNMFSTIFVCSLQGIYFDKALFAVGTVTLGFLGIYSLMFFIGIYIFL